MFFKRSVTLLSGLNVAYEENRYHDEDFQCTNYCHGSNTFHTRHDSLLKIALEKVIRFQMSNVTLLSSRGSLQAVMHIPLWMLVKQPENLQYNVVSLVNVSDHVIEAESIKYKNDIHSD